MLKITFLSLGGFYLGWLIPEFMSAIVKKNVAPMQMNFASGVSLSMVLVAVFAL